MSKPRKQSIFDFSNYREFLKDAYSSLKESNPAFSFRYFSRIAGFKSPAVLKMVMDGERNIAIHSIDKFAKALKLGKEESFYFHHLVLLNQAVTIEDRQYHAEQLVSCRKLRELHPLAASQFNFYRHWYFVPIRELVSTKGFREDPEWIARKVSPRITSLEAATALGELLKLGLIRRGKNGKLEQTSATLSTGDDVSSTAVHLWHLEMMKRAGESIDRHPFDRRDISAVTVGVSADTVSRLKAMIVAFRNAIVEECAKDASLEVVYQLGIQFFPLTENERKGGDT